MNFTAELNIFLPQAERIVWERLLNAGFPTYLVGGSVRDIVLNKTPMDFDLATKATPEEIKNLFRDKEWKVDLVGAVFGVTLVNNIEVATFRGDNYYGGDKDVDIHYVGTIEEDLARRDFTFNAMAIDIYGNLIDPYNGVFDLLNVNSKTCNHEPILRFVGNAGARIHEDPNRVFRAFRFCAVLNAQLDDESYHAIIDNVHLTSQVSPERVRLEILKTLSTSVDPTAFWTYMWITGVMDIFFPEMSATVGHDHGEYHDEDIWEHSLIACSSVSKRFPLIRLAAFVHDVGKVPAYNPEERSFYQHHTFSADIVRNWMTLMTFSKEEIRFVVNLVLIHMDGTRNMSPKARRRLKNKLGRYELHWRDYVRLRIADRAGNKKKRPFSITDIKCYIRHFTEVEEVPITVNHLALKGGDIIKIFRLQPGPQIGMLQRKLLDIVLEEGEHINNIANLVQITSALLYKNADYMALADVQNNQ